VGGIMLLHLLAEGCRWQLIPAYLIVLISAWCLYKSYYFFKGSRFRKIASGVFYVILLAIGWAAPYAIPVFDLPTPTGTYSIGSQYIHIKTNEDEIITNQEGDKRELMVKVWYPAIIKDAATEAYLNNGDRIGFALKYGLPEALLNYLDLVKTNTYMLTEIEDGKFPVLIFSPGFYSSATGYYALIEEIVSHGYIVLNINPTYESTGSLFSNGNIKLFNAEFDKKHNNQKMGEMAWFASQAYLKASTFNGRFLAIEYAVRNYIAAETTIRWSNDISLVIDELETGNNSSFLANHIDISRLGAFGHSQGGSAAGQALLADERVLAAINIDGVHWGNMIDTFMTKPFALLSSDWEESHPNFNEIIYQKGSTTDFYNAKILNSGHSNFMDIPLMVRIPIINEAGSIDPSKGYALSSKFILRFFDKHLMGIETDLLGLCNEFEELEINLIKKK